MTFRMSCAIGHGRCVAAFSDTEYVHGRNLRRAQVGQSWQAFAAARINAEARMAHEEEKAKVATKRSPSLPSVADAVSAPPRATPRVRNTHTACCFHGQLVQPNRRGWASRSNHATSETHAEMEAAYARLHPEDKRVHEVEAAMSPSACQARCRMVAKAQRSQVLCFRALLFLGTACRPGAQTQLDKPGSPDEFG